jgi:predicted neuraminidase
MHRLLFAATTATALFVSFGSPVIAATGNRAQDSPTFAVSAELPGAETAMIPTLYPSSHASNLLLLRNGDVMCFWFSGSAEGEGDVGIVVSRLPKNSSTWSPAQLIDRDPAKSYQNPVPFEAPDGTVWLLHTQQTANKGQGDAQVLKVVSHTGGRTWGHPEVLFDKQGSYDRQPIVIGDHGEWIVPMYYSTSAGITKGAQTNYTVVEVSRDLGKTWQEVAVPESEGLVQMSIVKLGAGKYVAFYRSRYADFIYRSTSADGAHWSKPVATVLPNNNASIQASALANGHSVMAFNNTQGAKPGRVPQTGPRVPLSLGLSEDGGVTWKYVRDLEVPASQSGAGQQPGAAVINLPRGQEYSYPSILQLPDGNILTTYTYRRQAIKAVRASEQWIREGNTVGVYKPQKEK